MSEPTTQAADAGTAAPPPGAAADAATTQAETTVAARPAYVPEQFWDDKAGAMKTDEFGKHYTELSTNAQKAAERAAAVPAKPEEYKIDLKLPDGVKPPEGVTFDPAKDPRLPEFLKTAHAIGLTQAEVNQLVALDAQVAIADHNARLTAQAEAFKAETAKLGEKAVERRNAIVTWASGLKDKGDLSSDEFEEIRATTLTAAGTSALEKIIAKATGSVPGTQQPRDPPAQPKTIAERLYPNLPSGLPPSSARSA